MQTAVHNPTAFRGELSYPRDHRVKVCPVYVCYNMNRKTDINVVTRLHILAVC